MPRSWSKSHAAVWHSSALDGECTMQCAAGAMMAVPQFSEVPDAQHRSKALGFFMSVAPTTTLVDIHFLS